MGWLFERLGFVRAGEVVEVRSASEILATLDERGRTEGMPFMEEMLALCGRRLRVSKSAHKTCDTIKAPLARRLPRAAHLEGLRCDGSRHDGCQAGCQLFFKTQWLKPAGGETRPARADDAAAEERLRALLSRAAKRADETGEALYACQATAILEATKPLAWWNPGQYLRDLASGNIGLAQMLRYGLRAARNMVTRMRWPGSNWPNIGGKAQGPVADARLGLRPGEFAQVRSKDEIMGTLGPTRKFRGLWFDIEMEPHCGKTYRVLSRVERLIDERTGRMIKIGGDCIVLEGVACSGCLSKDRLFCPRALYPYWREIWLRRVAPPAGTVNPS
ncbi:MAG TPA: hypothetical protein VHC42_12930 [Rhizomicrobium sp.]|nr:hypothetical protein [Rhizomicrobium sp.]